MAIQVTKRPYSTCFSGNPVHYELYSPQAEADRTIYFEVRVKFKAKGATAYTDVVTLKYDPFEGVAKVDIKDIIHSQLKYKVPPVDYFSNTVWSGEEQTGHCYIEYREITTLAPDPAWDSSEADFPRFCVKGGLNYFRWRGNNFWANYFPVQKPFLTWQKSGRKAAPSERMFLAWLNTSDADVSLTAWFTPYYTDGTAAPPLRLDFGSSKGLVHFIPVGHDQLALATVDPSKDVWYWTVKVTNHLDEEVSETFTYYRDNIHDYNGITLHYRNSLGGLDSVRVRGVVDEGLSYSFSEQGATVGPDYFSGDVVAAQRRISDNREQKTWKGDVGHLGREEQDRLRDAFQQREVYWEREGVWWPVILINRQQRQRVSTDQRWSMPIEWELAYEGAEYYTPDAVELGAEVFESNTCRATLTPSIIAQSPDVGMSEVIMDLAETDPDAASDQFRYRVLRSDGTTWQDWMVLSYSNLPIGFDLDTSYNYTVEFQAICSGDLYGAKATLSIQF